eukprot:scaffold22596_cov131-Cylindrotheca_fusiformis.AAC.20
MPITPSFLHPCAFSPQPATQVQYPEGYFLTSSSRMLRTPHSSSRPPRPRRTIAGYDDAADNASGIFSTSGSISDTTMASFLIDPNGRAKGLDNSNQLTSPNTAVILRRKQQDAQVAIYSLNQFIFQAGNLYRGNRLNQEEQDKLRDSAERVGLSMDIVDGLLQHTSDSNAVVQYCMESNDAFARKIKEDSRLSRMLQQDASDGHVVGSFDLRNSIWRVFMHKIVQQVLRDHGMDINDVLNKSSLTSRLYEEALQNDGYSAERQRIERNYSEERRHLSLSEDEIKCARRNAAAQVPFQHSRLFDHFPDENDVPLIIGGGPPADSRDDDMSLLTMTEPQREVAPQSPVIERQIPGRKVQTPPIYPTNKVKQANRIRGSPRKAAEPPMAAVSPSRQKLATLSSEKIVDDSPNVARPSPSSSSPSAPVSAVKRALAMFETPTKSESDHRPKKPHSTSKVGGGSSSLIANRLAVFERKTNQENDEREGLVHEPSASSEHKSAMFPTLFDVFASPQKKTGVDKKPQRAASTSQISKVKRSQIAAFENTTSHENKENSTKKVNKLNPEVRRLFDTNSDPKSKAACDSDRISSLMEEEETRQREVQKRFLRDNSIAKRYPVVRPEHSGRNGRLSAVEVSRLLQTCRGDSRGRSKDIHSGSPHQHTPPPHSNRNLYGEQQPFTSLDNVQRPPHDLHRQEYSDKGRNHNVPFMEISLQQRNSNITDTTCCEVSEMSDPAQVLSGEEKSLKKNCIPPTQYPTGQGSPNVRFHEMMTTTRFYEPESGFNNHCMSPSVTKQQSPSQPTADRGHRKNLIRKGALDKMLHYARTPKAETSRKQTEKSAELRDFFLASMNEPTGERQPTSGEAHKDNSTKEAEEFRNLGTEIHDYGPPRIMRREPPPKQRLRLDEDYDLNRIGVEQPDSPHVDQPSNSARDLQWDEQPESDSRQIFLHEMLPSGASSNHFSIDDRVESLSYDENPTLTESPGVGPCQQENQPWVEFQQMFGSSLHKAENEPAFVGSDPSRSNQNFEYLADGRKEVCNEAIGLDRRNRRSNADSARQSREPSQLSTREGNRGTSLPFFEGVKLSGRKAEFRMIDDENDKHEYDSDDEPFASLQEGDFDGLNEVSNEAIDLDGRNRRSEADSTRQSRERRQLSSLEAGNKDTSLPFFEGLKLSGRKADLHMIDDENDKHEYDSDDEPFASLKGGDFGEQTEYHQTGEESVHDSSERHPENTMQTFSKQTRPEMLFGPQTDPGEWATFQNTYFRNGEAVGAGAGDMAEESGWPVQDTWGAANAKNLVAPENPIENRVPYSAQGSPLDGFDGPSNMDHRHQPQAGESNHINPHSEITIHEQDEHLTASTLTFSTIESDFDAFNFYEPTESKAIPHGLSPVQEKARKLARTHLKQGQATGIQENVDTPTVEEYEASGHSRSPLHDKAIEMARVHLTVNPAEFLNKKSPRYHGSPLYDKAIEKARVHLERDPNEYVETVGYTGEEELPAPPSIEDDGLPAPPSDVLADEDEGHCEFGQKEASRDDAFLAAKTPRARSYKAQENQYVDDYGDLELQKSSSSLSRLLRVDTEQSEEDNTWLNSIEREDKQASNPNNVRETVPTDEESQIRSAAEANGVPSHVLDIILQQAQAQEEELIRSEKEQDLTSWDAIANEQTTRAPNMDASPAGDSSNSVGGIHPPGKSLPDNSLDVSMIPDEIPEGVSQDDVKLLHRFIQLSSSDTLGRPLSADAEARVRAAAIKVGLAEVVIDQMLLQARWRREQNQQQAEVYHQYHHGMPPIQVVENSDGHKFPSSPCVTHQSSVHENKDYRQHWRRHRAPDPYCYDTCTILGNLKENLMHWANCNRGGSFDDDASNVSASHHF